jgi:hypothetical protein
MIQQCLFWVHIHQNWSQDLEMPAHPPGTPLFTTAKMQEQPKFPSIDDWKKENVVHTHKGVLFTL